MSRLEHLLATMAQLEAEALLLHGGERVVALSANGQTPLPGMVLTAADIERIVVSVLPDQARRALDERGSLEHRWAGALPDGGDLTVTAIKTASDVWIELRHADGRCAGHGAAAGSRRDVSIAADVPFTRWIRRAHELGAESLVVAAGARPVAKIDGAVQALTDAAVDPAALPQSLVALSEAVARAGGVERDGGLEWTIPGVGAVTCRMTADMRGPGVFFDLRAASTPNLDLPGVLRELVLDADGLLVVAGRTAQDRLRMAHALVDTVSRNRPAHIICLEQARTCLHDHHAGLVSQRLVGDGSATAWQAALEQVAIERPDVVMIEDPPPARLLERPLEWAAGGTLVVLIAQAASAVAALEALIDRAADGRRDGVARRWADVLAGAAALATLPRRRGGRVSACEVLPGTPRVRALLAEQAFDRLALALERGDGGARSFAVALSELIARNDVGLRAALPLVSDPAALLTAARRVHPAAGAVESSPDGVELAAAVEQLLD